jgi:DNA-binding MarR family transcriptional regulator
VPIGPDPVPADLEERLRDLLKAVRLTKARWLHQRSVIPSGMIGVLAGIATLSARPSPPGCHLKDLATWSALDSSTVSRAVSSLVDLGLVERSADPADRRAHLLLVTQRGHELRRFTDDLMTHLDTSPAPTAHQTTPEAAR